MVVAGLWAFRDLAGWGGRKSIFHLRGNSRVPRTPISKKQTKQAGVVVVKGQDQDRILLEAEASRSLFI